MLHSTPEMDANGQPTANNGNTAAGAHGRASIKQNKRQSMLLLKRKFSEISAMIEGTAHEARGLVVWKQAQQSTKQVQLSAEDQKQLEDNHKRRIADITSKQALQAVKSAMAHKWAWPFNQPVDTEKYKDYLLVVKQPMDFGTIKNKCEAGQYNTPDQLLTDVRLVFDNARKYNPPGTDVFVMAQTVQDKFMERWKAQVEPKIKEEQTIVAAAEAAVKRQLIAVVMEKQSQAVDSQVNQVLGALQDIQHRIAEAKSLAAMLSSPLSNTEVEALAARLTRLTASQLEPIISLLVHHSPGLSMEKSDFDLDLHSYDALLLRQLDYYATACDSAGLLEPATENGAEGGQGEEVTRTIPLGPATLDGAPRCPVKFPNIAIGAGLKARPRADLQVQDPIPIEPKPVTEPALRPILSQASVAVKAAGSPAAPGSPLMEVVPMAVSPVGGSTAPDPAVQPATLPSSAAAVTPPSLSIRTQRPLPAGVNGVAAATSGGSNPNSPYHPNRKAPLIQPACSSALAPAASVPISTPHIPPVPGVDWPSTFPRPSSRLTTHSSTPLSTSIFPEASATFNQTTQQHPKNPSLSIHNPVASPASLPQATPLSQPPTVSQALVATPASMPQMVSTSSIVPTTTATAMFPAGLHPSLVNPTTAARLQAAAARQPPPEGSWGVAATSSPHPTGPMTSGASPNNFVPLVLPPTTSNSGNAGAASSAGLTHGVTQGVTQGVTHWVTHGVTHGVSAPLPTVTPSGLPQAVHAMLNPMAFPGLRTASGQLAALAAGLTTAGAVGQEVAGSRPAAANSVVESVGRAATAAMATVTTVGSSRLQDSSPTADNDGTIMTPAKSSHMTNAPSTIATSLALSASLSTPHVPPSMPIPISSAPPISQPPLSLLPTVTTISSITSSAPAALPAALVPASSPSLTTPLGMINERTAPSTLAAKAAAMAQALRGVRGPAFTMPAASAVVASGTHQARALHLGPTSTVVATPVMMNTPSSHAMVASSAATSTATLTTVLPVGAAAGGTAAAAAVHAMPVQQPMKDGVGSATGTEGAVVVLSGSQAQATKPPLSAHVPASMVPLMARPASTDQIAASTQFPLLTTQNGQPISVLNLSGPLSPAGPMTGKPATAHIVPVFASPQTAAALQLPVAASAAPSADHVLQSQHVSVSAVQHPGTIPGSSQPITASHPPTSLVPMFALNVTPSSAPPQPSSTPNPLANTIATLVRPASAADSAAVPPAVQQASQGPTALPAPATMSVLNLQQASASAAQISSSQPAAVAAATSTANTVLPMWHSTAQLPSGITVAVLPAGAGAGQATLLAPSQAQATSSQPLPATLQLLGHAGGRQIQVVPVQSLSPQQQRLQHLNLQALSQHLMQQVGGHQVIAVHPLQSGQAHGSAPTLLQLAPGTAMLQLPTILPAASHLLQAPKPGTTVQTAATPQQFTAPAPQAAKHGITTVPSASLQSSSLPPSSTVLVSTAMPPPMGSVATAGSIGTAMGTNPPRTPITKPDADKVSDSSHQTAPKVQHMLGVSSVTPGIITSSSTTATLTPAALQSAGAPRPHTAILTPSAGTTMSGITMSGTATSLPGLVGPMPSMASLSGGAFTAGPLQMNLAAAAAAAKSMVAGLNAAALSSGTLAAVSNSQPLSVPTATVITPASSLPTSSLPASALIASSLPTSSLPSSFLPSSSLPASALPASSLPSSSLPSFSLPASSLPSSALPSSSLPSSLSMSFLPDPPPLVTMIPASSSTGDITDAGLPVVCTAPSAAIIGTANISMPPVLPGSASMIGAVGVGTSESISTAGIMSAAGPMGEPTAGIVSGSNLGISMNLGSGEVTGVGSRNLGSGEPSRVGARNVGIGELSGVGSRNLGIGELGGVNSRSLGPDELSGAGSRNRGVMGPISAVGAGPAVVPAGLSGTVPGPSGTVAGGAGGVDGTFSFAGTAAAGAGADTAAGTRGADTGTVAGAGTGTGTGTVASGDAGTGAGTGTVASAGIGMGTGTGACSDAGTGIGTGGDAGTGADGGICAGDGAGGVGIGASTDVAAGTTGAGDGGGTSLVPLGAPPTSSAAGADMANLDRTAAVSFKDPRISEA